VTDVTARRAVGPPSAAGGDATHVPVTRARRGLVSMLGRVLNRDPVLTLDDGGRAVGFNTALR
jgi:hypothetical protein